MNPKLTILRIEKTSDGVLGIMFIDGLAFCVTLEPEDLNNVPMISCIPAGDYECKRYHSLRYPDTYVVRNVPGRSLILFHAGNTEDDTKGCILLGSSFGKMREKRAIFNSGATFKLFLNKLEDYDILNLTIKEIQI